MTEEIIKRRPNYDIVLRGLKNGFEIKLPDGEVCAMVDNTLYLARKVWINKQPDGKPDRVEYVEFDISFNSFMRLCNQLTEEEIFSIVSRNALKGERDDRKRRIRRAAGKSESP